MIAINRIVWTAVAFALASAVIVAGSATLNSVFVGIGIGAVCIWAADIIEKVFLS